jgi:hypothetical protein
MPQVPQAQPAEAAAPMPLSASKPASSAGQHTLHGQGDLIGSWAYGEVVALSNLQRSLYTSVHVRLCSGCTRGQGRSAPCTRPERGCAAGQAVVLVCWRVRNGWWN